jgi:hypothetical protein
MPIEHLPWSVDRSLTRQAQIHAPAPTLAVHSRFTRQQLHPAAGPTPVCPPAAREGDDQRGRTARQDRRGKTINDDQPGLRPDE